MSSRLEFVRTATDRGATIVEYALVAALLLVGMLVVVEGLTAATDREIDNQADCVSMRPPPEECQLAAVPPSTTTTVGGGPPTTAPPLEEPPQPLVAAHSADWDAAEETIILTTEMAVAEPAEVTVGEPLPGVPIQVQFRMVDPATPSSPYNIIETFDSTCTTGADGICQIEFFVPYTDVTRVFIEYTVVNTDPPPEDVPAVFSITR